MNNTEPEMKTFLHDLLLLQKDISDIESIDHTPYLFADDKGRASQRLSAVVKFTDQSLDLNLFLKVNPYNHETINFLNEKLSLFDKETDFYANILPILVEFEKKFRSKDAVSIQQFFLNYFGSGSAKGNFFIVLERFSSDDYTVSEQIDFHNDDKVKSVMESLAVFHATSYCMKFALQKDFMDEFPMLADKLFHPSNHRSIGHFFITNFKAHVKLLKSVLKEMHKDPYIYGKLCFSDVEELHESVLQRLEKLSDDIMMILHRVQQCDERYKVITHGDCHLWNIAFSKEGKDLPLKYFDFQLTRYTSFLIDIQHYLSQVTTPNTRKYSLKEFLGYYYEKFNEVCSSYNLPGENKITYADIESEYKRTHSWQFLFGFIFILPRFVNKDFYTKLNTLKTDSQIMSLLYEQQGGDIALTMVKTYFEIVLEAENEGTLNEMERLVAVEKN